MIKAITAYAPFEAIKMKIPKSLVVHIHEVIKNMKTATQLYEKC